MGSNVRKFKKHKKRQDRIKKDSLHKKQAGSNTQAEKALGSYKLYILFAIIILTSIFVFYNMK
ncbi:MAG: hypothetical protein ISR65_18660 [Bacteriovoracaceae bacterium]|nr:hypothetical protein [Bacteriovoracaceae bacterium]